MVMWQPMVSSTYLHASSRAQMCLMARTAELKAVMIAAVDGTEPFPVAVFDLSRFQRHVPRLQERCLLDQHQ